VANKIPNSRQNHGGMRRGPSQKNVVSGGRRKANPASEATSMMRRGKMKGPGVDGK
jgi:hypothetical protein